MRELAEHCTSASQVVSGASPGVAMRTGRVLMNRPIVDSTPGKSVGRPDSVLPNTTSGLPP
jgi:hypothetical protein